MATEKTYLKEGEKLPQRGNMDTLEPEIDALRTKAEKQAKEQQERDADRERFLREYAKAEQQGSKTSPESGTRAATPNPNATETMTSPQIVEGDGRRPKEQNNGQTSEPAQNGESKVRNATEAEKKQYEVEFGKIAKALDRNNDDVLSKSEAKEWAKIENDYLKSQNLSAKDKAFLLKGLEENGKDFTDEKLAKLSNLKVEEGFTKTFKEEIRESLMGEAKGKGVASAKDGKSEDKEKNPFMEFLTMIIALVKEFFRKNDETAVANKDGQTTGQQTAQAEGGKGREQQKEAKLTPDEQKKSLAYLKELGDDFQNSIKNAGKELSGNGIMLAGLPEKFSPRAQIIGAKLPTSDVQKSV